jgi:hypothetical protein
MDTQNASGDASKSRDPRRRNGIQRPGTVGLVWCCLCLLGGISNAFSLGPVRPGQEASITRAVFAQSILWLLTDAGTLSMIREGADERVEVPLDEPALGLWLQNDAPAVVTQATPGHGPFTLRRWSAGGWSADAHIPADEEQLVGVSARGATVTLLTSKRVIDVGVRKFQARAVHWPEHASFGGVTSILSTAKSVLLGVNMGEWGGGLWSLDRSTGQLTVIKSNANGEFCGGPLNPQCDPVNAIVAQPHHPDCVLIAIGLVHFSPHGRIDEVCGTRVRRVFFKPYGAGDHKPSGHGDEPFSTVAFFGLATVNDEVLAVGIDGIYPIGTDGAGAATPLPEFQKVGNVAVSFALPAVVLLRTDVNQRRSISGSVPMMVPRS